MDFITVEQAEQIILSLTGDFGEEEVGYEKALGRVLAEDLYADRDLPPANRSKMDGIAIHFEAWQNGQRSFKIKAVQAAGASPEAIVQADQCIEIMTGAVLDSSVDTVIRYEDVDINDKVAALRDAPVRKGQNIHLGGQDKKKGEIVAGRDRVITSSLIGLAASIGKTTLKVKKLPRVVIITTGDEMIPANAQPESYQLRRSNGVTIQAALKHFGISADRLHLNDNWEDIMETLTRCINEYDVLLMSGGVSMGKFDYIPKALTSLGVEQLFHKVKQKPGKPFWLGQKDKNKHVFAFPGNPVSAFMCLHRYFIPWLKQSLGLKVRPEWAVLQNDIHFKPELQYFVQVKLAVNNDGQQTAEAVNNNGSGDYSHLIYTDAFMELPAKKQTFKKGEVYSIWRYNL